MSVSEQMLCLWLGWEFGAGKAGGGGRWTWLERFPAITEAEAESLATGRWLPELLAWLLLSYQREASSVTQHVPALHSFKIALAGPFIPGLLLFLIH